jgi:Protein of unknown function (DUF3306)
MTDGFLGRWSRRKLAAGDGKPLAEPELPLRASGDAPAPAAVTSQPPPVPAPEAGPQPPLPTLDEARALTPESDFKPFLARGVAPEVRNAAVRKLFADPHFNVMDRLDTYIDDYSQPDPLPAALLRQMASAQFLQLVDEPDSAASAVADPAGAGDDADAPVAPDVAQSADTNDLAGPPAPTDAVPATRSNDAHADLRLQPDHAAPGERTGRGTA